MAGKQGTRKTAPKPIRHPRPTPPRIKPPKPVIKQTHVNRKVYTQNENRARQQALSSQQRQQQKVGYSTQQQAAAQKQRYHLQQVQAAKAQQAAKQRHQQKMIIAQQRAKLANQKAKLAAQRYKDLKTPHKIKHQLKNVQISQSARKSTIGAAGANYDNTWFEDMAGVPKNFILYKGTPSERKGTIKEWNSMSDRRKEIVLRGDDPNDTKWLAGGQHKYFYNEKWLKGLGDGFNMGSERNRIRLGLEQGYLTVATEKDRIQKGLTHREYYG